MALPTYALKHIILGREPCAPSPDYRQRKQELSLKQNLLIVALLLLLFMSRLVALDSFPAFVDETVHIHSAEQIPATSFLFNVQVGRILTIWWYYLFQTPYALAPIWLARFVTLLIVLLGQSALLFLGRRIAGNWALGLIWAFLLFSNYHFFFERLALADPISGALVLLAIAFAYRLRLRLNYLDAVLTAFTLFLAVLAKTNALPYLGILLAAALCLRPVNAKHLRQTLQWFLVGLVSFAIPGLLFEILTRLAGKAWLSATFTYIQSRSSSEATLPRILGNMLETLDFVSAYLHPVFFTCLLLAVLRALWQRQFYLVLVFAAPLLPLWLGEPQETRYWIVPIALLGLIGAIAFAPLLERLPRLAQAIAAVLLLSLGLLTWLPQAITTAQNPVQLTLPAIDRRQYIESDAIGFGFAEIAALIPDANRPLVLGFLANCQGFRYTYRQEYELHCETVNPDGSDIDELLALVEDLRGTAEYLILEESAYFPASIDAELLGIVERPANRANLRLYRLSP
jgi:hypothetical protein